MPYAKHGLNWCARSAKWAHAQPLPYLLCTSLFNHSLRVPACRVAYSSPMCRPKGIGMRRAQKKKVAASEDGPSASAAPAPRIPSAKPAPPVAAAQGGHADELVCLQVQLRQAVEDEDAAQEAYIGRNKLLESAIAEYRKEAQELEQLYEWQEREVGDPHGASQAQMEAWARGLKRIVDLQKVLPVHVRVCEEMSEETGRELALWEASIERKASLVRAIAAWKN